MQQRQQGSPNLRSARDERAGAIYTLLAAGGFAAVSTFTQIATDHSAALWNILFLRYALGAVVMGAGIAALGYPRLGRRDAAYWIVLGGGGQALLIGLALSSLRFVSVATLAFLFYTYPAWVALLQAMRGVERLNGRRLTALVLSFGGIVVVAGRPGGDRDLEWQGITLGLSAAIVYAGYIPLMQWMQRDLPIVLTSAYAKIGSAAAFLVLGLTAHVVTTRVEPTAWAAIAGLVVLSTVLPTVLFMMGLMRLGPVRTAIISSIEPFITAVFGAIVLGQRIPATTLLGGTLIVGAVLLLQRATRMP